MTNSSCNEEDPFGLLRMHSSTCRLVSKTLQMKRKEKVKSRASLRTERKKNETITFRLNQLAKTWNRNKSDDNKNAKSEHLSGAYTLSQSRQTFCLAYLRLLDTEMRSSAEERASNALLIAIRFPPNDSQRRLLFRHISLEYIHQRMIWFSTN